MTSIALVTNPISGSGRSLQVCRALEAALITAGHTVRLVESSLDPVRSWLDPVLQESDLVLAAGGDGTVRMVAESASRTGTPLHQIPMGTENLFARTFGMTAEPSDLIDAIESWRVERLDMIEVAGVHGLLMIGFGFDAAVVCELAARRRGPISHWTYVPIVLRQLLRWRPVPMQVAVDGQPVATTCSGLCFVCNSREYGGGFNPAPMACMHDGALDVVVLPTRSRFGLLRWMLKARRGRHLDDVRAIHVQGRSVELAFESSMLWQLDGDPPPEASGVERLGMKIVPGVLPVLLPAHGG